MFSFHPFLLARIEMSEMRVDAGIFGVQVDRTPSRRYGFSYPGLPGKKSTAGDVGRRRSGSDLNRAHQQSLSLGNISSLLRDLRQPNQQMSLRGIDIYSASGGRYRKIQFSFASKRTAVKMMIFSLAGDELRRVLEVQNSLVHFV
jgi:hypothetical protein